MLSFEIYKMNINYIFYTTDGTIIVHGVELIPFFDTPHVFKGLRNNMLTKDLEIDTKLNQDPKVKKKFAKITPESEKNRKFAKWEHVKIAYNIDVNGSRGERHLGKLTEQHVAEHKIKKMSVHHATQVLSETVGTEIKKLVAKKGEYLK